MLILSITENVWRNYYFILYSQRDQFNQSASTANQEIYRADAYKQKMETLAAELQTKKAAERKRLENEHNFRQQILSLEKELEALDEQGMLSGVPHGINI